MERNDMEIKNKRDRKREGFSYVDIMVGVSLLGVGILAIVPMFGFSMRANAIAGDGTVAVMLVQSKAAELRKQEFASLTAGTTGDMIQVRQINYQRTWTITDDTPQIGMKTISVTVEADRDDKIGNLGAAGTSFYRVE